MLVTPLALGRQTWSTGPVVGSAMMGYAKSGQVSKGINDRQWARSFIITDPATENRVAIIVIDACAVFNSVYREMVHRLTEKYGSLYSDQNLLITATHTHSGVAGQSHHFLYNMPSGTFDSLAFDKMVTGIIDSLSYAHEHLVEGQVHYAYGLLMGANVNRSLPAFMSNPDHFRFQGGNDQIANTTTEGNFSTNRFDISHPDITFPYFGGSWLRISQSRPSLINQGR